MKKKFWLILGMVLIILGISFGFFIPIKSETLDLSNHCVDNYRAKFHLLLGEYDDFNRQIDELQNQIKNQKEVLGVCSTDLGFNTYQPEDSTIELYL